LKTIHDYIGLCSPSLLQKAIAGYIDNNDFGITYSAGLRQKINISFKLLHTALINKGFKIRGINGGYFIWTELPFGYDDCFKFTIDLYEQEKVAVIPGIHFDRNARKFIRFNIARPVEDINTAIERLNRFLA
ncbi:MAG: aminotransferase class I/II-fold pyridoxal phosphate-dependent enzyme, partial [Bacteroidales bacterium]|nr:aminotransferase class I/II-fold pyridoxal phosphate-dependent enzyme [Bacteroidales bacterium]